MRFPPSAGNANSFCMPLDRVLPGLRLSLRYFLVFPSHHAGSCFCAFASREVVPRLHDTRGQKTLDYIHMTAGTCSLIQHRTRLPGCFPNRRILLHWQTHFIKVLLPEVQRQHANVDWTKHWTTKREDSSQLPKGRDLPTTETGESKKYHYSQLGLPDFGHRGYVHT